MIKRFLAVMAAATAVLGAGAGAALAAYPPDMQAGAVSATSILRGAAVDFSGDGFADGSKVVISVNKAVYATVNAGTTRALGSRSSLHVTTAAFARNASVAAAAVSSASFSVKVTLQTVGANVLTGTGVAPDGTPHMVAATVTVAEAEAAKSTASGLPFTGSAVIIPGVIVGSVMVAGGFLMLTTVRSRKAGARS